MKTLKSLLYVFLAAFLFVGCNDDENFNPGEPEDPDCYSVYFPTQENIGSKELDPAAPTEMTFTVRRLKSEGAIVVPVAVTSSEEGIFVPSQIEFADGQEETTFSIQFPQAEIGTTYKCEVNIEDKKYASVYGEKAARPRASGATTSFRRCSIPPTPTPRSTWRFTSGPTNPVTTA